MLECNSVTRFSRRPAGYRIYIYKNCLIFPFWSVNMSQVKLFGNSRSAARVAKGGKKKKKKGRQKKPLKVLAIVLTASAAAKSRVTCFRREMDILCYTPKSS